MLLLHSACLVRYRYLFILCRVLAREKSDLNRHDFLRWLLLLRPTLFLQLREKQILVCLIPLFQSLLIFNSFLFFLILLLDSDPLGWFLMFEGFCSPPLREWFVHRMVARF